MIDQKSWDRLVWKSELPYTYGPAWALGLIGFTLLLPLVYWAMKGYVLLWLKILQ